MAEHDAVLVEFADDLLLDANADGTAKTHVLGTRALWRLAKGQNAFLAGLEISELDTNAGVTLRWQWTVNGTDFKTGATVIAEKTAVDSYTGEHTARSEWTPEARLVAEVRDTVGSAQVTARISSWGLHWYRT